MPGVADLGQEAVREALRLLGEREAPPNRAAAARRLRERLSAHGDVRSLLDRAPEGARSAFVRLANDGPANVTDLLGRGWWGRGMLPPPLDWLQRRGLVVVADDGLVHATDEAREGFLTLTLDFPEPAETTGVGVVVHYARSVVVAPEEILDQALGVAAAALRAVAPTVALSAKPVAAVTAALRAAGVRLADHAVVPAEPGAPALPTAVEEAVGPRAVRSLLQRAVSEGRQVRLQYFASSRGGAATERVVDPWSFGDDLMRGYCHLRSGERTFAVDRIGRAQLLPSALQHPAQ